MSDVPENTRIEPVWVFLLGGLAILVLGFIADAKEPAQRGPAMDARVQAAIAVRADQTKRALTDEEIHTLRETLLDTEALVEEAKELGLDRGDHIVRRRLAQKRRALWRPSAPEANSAETPPGSQPSVTQHSFHHIFLAHGPEGDVSDARLEAARDALAAGTPWATLGDPFIRGQRFEDVDATDVSRVFGPRFSDALTDLAPDTWSVVASSYGTHLVYLSARSLGTPGLSAARDARATTKETMRQREQALLPTLRRAFPIHREPPPEDQL